MTRLRDVSITADNPGDLYRRCMELMPAISAMEPGDGVAYDVSGSATVVLRRTENGWTLATPYGVFDHYAAASVARAVYRSPLVQNPLNDDVT